MSQATLPMPAVSSREKMVALFHRYYPSHVVGEVLTKRWMESIIPFTILVIAFGTVALTVPHYFGLSNLSETSRLYAEQGLIGLGFALLTLTVLSGVFFSDALFGQPLRLDHKTVFTLIAWVTFGALLVGRVTRGWRGRVALSWTLSGFAMLILAYAGSRFVLEVILHRV